MIYAALAVIALFVVVTLLLPKLATVNPSSAALGVRRTLGGTILAMSAFTALRGLLPVAVSLFLLGLAIMNAQGVFRKAGKEKGQRSSVKTSVLEMNLDHDTGAMDGQVLSGQFEGRALSTMALPELLVLLKQCVAANDQSEALLMAYLDRVHEGWREQAGTAGGASSNAAGGMSRAEAFDVLGLERGRQRGSHPQGLSRADEEASPGPGGLGVVCRAHQ
jgi:hypothetical protein